MNTQNVANKKFSFKWMQFKKPTLKSLNSLIKFYNVLIIITGVSVVVLYAREGFTNPLVACGIGAMGLMSAGVSQAKTQKLELQIDEFVMQKINVGEL